MFIFLANLSNDTSLTLYRYSGKIIFETMIPCGTTATLKNGKKVSKPYFDFYNYAGIHRPVKLLCLPNESITDFTVNHRLVGADAEVDYTVETTGDKNTVVEVYDAEGNKVAEATGKEGTIVVKDAKLWNVHAAYLYKFVVKIVDGDAVIDEYYEWMAGQLFVATDHLSLQNTVQIH